MMAKKKSLFSMLKRLFIPDTHSRLEKKDKRKRWAFRLVKMRKLAPLSASSPPRETSTEATVEDNDNSLSLTTVTEDPWHVPGDVQSAHRYEESREYMESITHAKVPKEYHGYERAFQDLTATKIQAAYRGYLARKALRALKGVVKLQALIRGWAVRRQAINTLKCLQSIVNIQSEVCSKRCERIMHSHEYKSQELGEKDIKVDLNSQKRWDDSILTKNESKANTLSKREASIKRERIREYYLNHRRSAEIERDRAYGRRRYWLEQWVDAQLAKKDGPGKLGRTLSDKSRDGDEAGETQLSLKYLQKNSQTEMSDSPAYIPRRSFHHRKQRSAGDDSATPGSPSLPTYMASTESAKAKARSISSPRLRPISSDVCSDITSPYKHKLSPISSINSEMTSSSWVGNPISYSQRSPSLKGVAGPIKSNISTRDLRLHGICQHDNADATCIGNKNLSGR